MIKKLGMLLSVLLVGEIITTSAGILGHMRTGDIALFIVGFAGVWLIFVLACVWIEDFFLVKV
jgi:hypothetical protein